MTETNSIFRDPLLTKRLMEKHGDEQVLAIVSTQVADIADLFVSAPASAAKLTNRLQQNSRYVLRALAEQNATMQQIIPYVVIVNMKTPTTPYFVYERIGGEERLRNSWSLGVGGHINPEDGINNAINSCIQRELSEEIFYEPVVAPLFLGTIRNQKSALNDHLGLVYCQHVSSASVKEEESMRGFWCSFQDLFDNYDRFEDWGKFLIDYWYVNKNDGILF